MPSTVNYHYISTTFGQLSHAQVEQGPLALNPDDEAMMKTAYVAFIAPWVRESLSGHSQQLLKLSLAYFLQQKNFPDVLANEPDLPLVADPADDRQLFVWLWEVLYPNSRPDEVDTSQVKEDNDVMAVNRFVGWDLPDNYFRVD